MKCQLLSMDPMSSAAYQFELFQQYLRTRDQEPQRFQPVVAPKPFKGYLLFRQLHQSVHLGHDCLNATCLAEELGATLLGPGLPCDEG